MSTDLTSISTHGWFTEIPVKGYLLPVGTFGWYYDSAVSAKLEIIDRLLKINRRLESANPINTRLEVSSALNRIMDIDVNLNITSEVESVVVTSKRINLER